MENTLTTAEKKLAIDSLTVRRRMMVDCFDITKGTRREHYQECITKIDAELAELGKGVEACPMCAIYDRPGFVLNANQWVKCWQCNQHDERDTSDEPSASERRLAERRGIAASTIGANWGDV